MDQPRETLVQLRCRIAANAFDDLRALRQHNIDVNQLLHASRTAIRESQRLLSDERPATSWPSSPASKPG